MNRKYKKLVQILDSGNVSAAINSYESLPTRNSPKSLITSSPPNEDYKYEVDTLNDFMTLNKMKKKLGHSEEK